MNTTGAVLFAKQRDIVDGVHSQFRWVHQAEGRYGWGLTGLEAEELGARRAWLSLSPSCSCAWLTPCSCNTRAIAG
jgi:hypothetical protein